MSSNVPLTAPHPRSRLSELNPFTRMLQALGSPSEMEFSVHAISAHLRTFPSFVDDTLHSAPAFPLRATSNHTTCSLQSSQLSHSKYPFSLNAYQSADQRFHRYITSQTIHRCSNQTSVCNPRHQTTVFAGLVVALAVATNQRPSDAGSGG